MATGLLETLMKSCSSAELTPRLKSKPLLTSKDGFKFFPDMNPTTCQMLGWFFEGIAKVGIPFILVCLSFYIYRK
jgi:hypothetical protein